VNQYTIGGLPFAGVASHGVAMIEMQPHALCLDLTWAQPLHTAQIAALYHPTTRLLSMRFKRLDRSVKANK
jgi:hypothetical protein